MNASMPKTAWRDSCWRGFNPSPSGEGGPNGPGEGVLGQKWDGYALYRTYPLIRGWHESISRNGRRKHGDRAISTGKYVMATEKSLFSTSDLPAARFNAYGPMPIPHIQLAQRAASDTITVNPHDGRGTTPSGKSQLVRQASSAGSPLRTSAAPLCSLPSSTR